MNPSERSLEYSLLKLGEGHRIQPFPAPLPNEQTYGHGAPWTCLGDQNYLAWAATAEATEGFLGSPCKKQNKDKEGAWGRPATAIIIH